MRYLQLSLILLVIALMISPAYADSIVDIQPTLSGFKFKGTTPEGYSCNSYVGDFNVMFYNYSNKSYSVITVGGTGTYHESGYDCWYTKWFSISTPPDRVFWLKDIVPGTGYGVNISWGAVIHYDQYRNLVDLLERYDGEGMELYYPNGYLYPALDGMYTGNESFYKVSLQANYEGQGWQGLKTYYVNESDGIWDLNDKPHFDLINEGYPDGSYQARATLKLWTGERVDRESISFTLDRTQIDRAPPSISYTSPTPGGTYQVTQGINFTGKAVDDDVDIFRVYLGKDGVDYHITANYTQNQVTNSTIDFHANRSYLDNLLGGNYTEGTYEVKWKAVDDKGNTGHATYNITLGGQLADTTPPEIYVISPAPGSSHTDNAPNMTLPFVAEFFENQSGLKHTRLYINGNYFAGADNFSNPYYDLINTTVTFVGSDFYRVNWQAMDTEDNWRKRAYEIWVSTNNTDPPRPPSNDTDSGTGGGGNGGGNGGLTYGDEEIKNMLRELIPTLFLFVVLMSIVYLLRGATY